MFESSPTAGSVDTEAARLGIELRHMAGPALTSNALGDEQKQSAKAPKRRKRNAQDGMDGGGTPPADDDPRSMPRHACAARAHGCVRVRRLDALASSWQV